jgi:hypothetical protein
LALTKESNVAATVLLFFCSGYSAPNFPRGKATSAGREVIAACGAGASTRYPAQSGRATKIKSKHGLIQCPSA